MPLTWRCRLCWQLRSGQDAYCRPCNKHWTKCYDKDFKAENHHGRQPQGESAKSPRHRSGSRKEKKEKKDKEKKHKDKAPKDPLGGAQIPFPPPFQNTGKSPFPLPYAPHSPQTPWNPAAEIAASAATADHRELVQAVRTAFPDPSAMPVHLKAILDKSEQQCQKLLGNDMRKCTTTLQKSRKQLTELLEAKRGHQIAWIAWIAHVNEATRVWTEQTTAYAAQQDDYNNKIAAVQAELKAAQQQQIQDLGMQAIETQQIKEEEQDTSAKLDLEQAQAAQRLATALAQCTKAAEAAAGATPVEAMEILGSEEEEGEGRRKSRRTEARKRSLERPPPDSSAAAS